LAVKCEELLSFLSKTPISGVQMEIKVFCGHPFEYISREVVEFG